MSPMVRRPFTIELGLLGFLQHGPLHGYQIYQQISSRAGLQNVWKLKQAHVYALLAGWKNPDTSLDRSNSKMTRPAKRVYTLTPAGVDAFYGWLELR